MEMWGEVEGDVKVPQQAYVPLWHDRWRPTGVSCQVPSVLSSHKLNSTAGDLQSLPVSLDYPMDSHNSNLLLHCIELQQYVEDMQQMIASSAGTPSGLRDRESFLPPAPPTKYWNTSGRKTWEKPLVCNPESNLKQSITSHLDSKSCNLLQRKSVAAVSLLSGYEVATGQSLNVLSSILGNFLERFSTVLKRNSEDCQKSLQEGQLSLDLVTERTLRQFGLGGKRDLKEYWKKLGSRHSQLMEDASQQVEEWKKTMGGGNDAKDRDGLLKSMKLQLNENTKRGSFDMRLPSPWVASTPVLMGEEETLIAGDINLENVMPLKTPDVSVAPEFSHLASTNDEELSLEFEPPPSIPSRKRSVPVLPIGEYTCS